MERLLAVGLAGLVGTLCRYLLSGWVARRFGESFPAGTLVVNLSGCLMIGFLYHLLEERWLIDPIVRTGILIGFLGAFTTFSSFGLQTFTLMRDGELLWSGTYILVSNLGGFALVWIGYMIARTLTVTS
jgi:CrcB protein